MAFFVPLMAKWTHHAPRLFTIFALFISFVLSLKSLCVTTSHNEIFYFFGNWHPPLGIEWRIDSLSAFMLSLVTGFACLSLFATQESAQKEVGYSLSTFYMCILLLISGLCGLLMTRDLFNFFVFLEVSSLAAYALIATGKSKKSSYVSLKYLLIGSLGASLYLMGVGYLYANTGTLNMTDTMTRLTQLGFSQSTSLGIILIFLGLSIKMGLFPFHGWMPDTYTYASNPVSSLIAPIMTKVAIYGLLRIFLWGIGENLLHQLFMFTTLKYLGVVGLFIGSIFALIQTNFKRFLAYSSVSHIGLIAIGIGIHNQLSTSAAMLHILNHVLMKGSLFLLATSLITRLGIEEINDFHKIRSRMPWTAFFISLCLCSMVGLPPFTGFFSKGYILFGAALNKDFLTVGIIAISALFSALYSFRIIEKLYFNNLKSTNEYQEAPLPILGVTALLSLSLIPLGFVAPKLMHWMYHAFFSGVLVS